MDATFVDWRFKRSIEVKQKTLSEQREAILAAGLSLIEALQQGHKILFCGNGGSAADAQHLAAELVVKLAKPRRPLPGLALTTDTSILTATGNDFAFADIFARQVEALGQAGDVLIGNSTSGNSENVLRAMDVANQQGLVTVALLGRDGGKIAGVAKHAIVVPDEDTQRIQECHLLIGHIWMEMIDAELGERE
ncbi:MAG: D-sedoheptulose 7-phosphate isomerase [candidate division KSB1 bacterium]|nr:D-sedoheptulose 7-phosphate isomerase [candidate division KSB1 bacterium]MDQ7064923.1 D-sedoheptulose 7-phosphate isomerase [candidate division KSB1 bacterium]